MRIEDLKDGHVNRVLGMPFGYGIVPSQQLPAFAIILSLCLPLLIVNPIKGVLVLVLVYCTYWLITGNEPNRFYERLFKPSKYIAEEPIYCLENGLPLVEPGRKESTYMIKGKKVRYKHIERKFSAIPVRGQIELDNREVGFYLLQKGQMLMFIFAWEISGYPPSMQTDEAFSILSSATDALDSLPNDIDLKFYKDLNCSCDDYLRMQAEQLASRKHNALEKELVISRAKRVKELAAQGRFLRDTTIVLAKFRVPIGGEYAVIENWRDDLFSRLQPLIGVFKEKNTELLKEWERTIEHAYRYAFLKVHNLLTDSSGFGMRVRTLTVKQLWTRDYSELHTESPPDIPEYIVFDQDGLRVIFNESGTHSLGVLFEPEGGLPVVPRFERHYVYYPSKDVYAGFVRIGKIKRFPNDNGAVARGFIKYVWKILARTNQPIYDSRVVVEYTPNRDGLDRLQIERIISNSVKRTSEATKRRHFDVDAKLKLEQAIEAQEMLDDGRTPYWVSFGIWIYRKNKNDLDQAISDVLQRLSNAKAERSYYTVEHNWFQTWPFSWQAFLTEPHHQRQKYYSHNAVGTMPLVRETSIDDKGIMLLTRELNTPLYIDVANKKNHTAILATSGVGKSILILEFLTEFILNNHLIVLFDFPRPDGTSTYTTIIPLLKKLGFRAEYYDVRQTTVNIIEPPNLKHIENSQLRREVMEAAISNHIRLLTTLVLETKQDTDRESMITSLLSTAYDSFRKHPAIKSRFDKAVAGGFGSDDYKQMPILKDFIDYTDAFFKDLIVRESNTISTLKKDTIDIIMTKLRGVLPTPLGKSINGISSFDTNVDFLCIGLTQVSDNLDSLIYALGGLNVLFRGSMSSKRRSDLIVDEGTILFKFNQFAETVGTIPVHGRKWGCNFLIAAQEVKRIIESSSGNDILTNLDNVLCGQIQSPALEDMCNSKIGYRRENLLPYTTVAFKPNPQLLQSYWCLKRGDQLVEVVHTPSNLVLALGATEPLEDQARRRVIKSVGGDLLEGVNVFGKLYATAQRKGLSMQTIAPEVEI